MKLNINTLPPKTTRAANHTMATDNTPFQQTFSFTDLDAFSGTDSSLKTKRHSYTRSTKRSHNLTFEFGLNKLNTKR